MRVFVASWFFPPATSSEGIVTYKLLRNSEHTYDVCSAQSDLWGYNHALPLQADNIRVLPVKTDEIEEWAERALEIFEREHAQRPYDAVMTRTMPPESIGIGAAIKKAHPELPWIASLADPLARNPYQIKTLILDNEDMPEADKASLLNALSNGFGMDEVRDPGAQHLRKMKEFEDQAVNGADALIFPCETLKCHVLGTRQRKRAYVVPHSFDSELTPATRDAARANDDGTITFVFLGHSDNLRSLNPLVLALNHLKRTNPSLLDRIRVRCFGHVPSDTRDLIYNFHLHDVVSAEGSVDYLTSLSLMAQAQWLLHVDAYFDTHEDTGGSVFFAGKIADYLGTDAPILGLTGHGSPAEGIIKHAGGACVDPRDVTAIAEVLESIVEGRCAPAVDRAYRDRYASAHVATQFDRLLDDLVHHTPSFDRERWPVVAERKNAEKLVSICIPSYNVECYLDRCLFSLVSCHNAAALEIIVVNDGSKDDTLAIAQAYQARYPNVVRVVDKKNGGHGSTINAALEVATGRWFRVIDGDDWVDSPSFDKLLDNIVENNIDADLLSNNYYQVFLEDGHTYAWDKKGESEYYREYDFASADFTMEYFAMASAMFKTDLMRAADFKLQEHTFYVDVEYLLFPIPYTKTVMFTPEYVYRYAVGSADQSINPSTFTNRYDHHDRVIRRMLAYYKEHESSMGKGQNDYLRSLFSRHLLQSHYLLSLVWDPDRKRGLARAADFDAHLKSVDFDLWKACGKDYPAVAKARAKGFDPKRIKKPASIFDGKRSLASRCKSFAGRAARSLKRRLRNTDFGDKLVASDKARKVYDKVANR